MDCCVEANFLIDAIIPIEIDVSDAGPLAYVGSLHSSNIEFAFVVVDTQPIASPACVCPAICVCKGKGKDFIMHEKTNTVASDVVRLRGKGNYQNALSKLTSTFFHLCRLEPSKHGHL